MGKTDGLHDPYEDQLAAARYRAERDQARQELERERHQRKLAESAAAERDTVRAEDHEAAAWVREHGGLEEVRALNWLGAECASIVTGDGSCVDYFEADDVADALRARLMPEGMEWPRYEDNKPVQLGDKFECWCGKEHVVGSVSFRGSCAVLNMSHAHAFVVGHGHEVVHGERVKRPAPKVLDADGVEIELGDDLYSVEGSLKFHVSHVDRANGKIATDAMFAIDKWADPSLFTHRAPVLASDGEPLEVGQTVWHVDGRELTVVGLPRPGEYQAVKLRLDDGAVTGLDPDQLTHQRPVLDADGVPIHEGDTLYGVGRTQHVFVALGQPGLGGGNGRFKIVCHDVTDGVDCDCDPSLLTHTKPEPADSWEQLKADIYREIETDKGMRSASEFVEAVVRRCKALAGVSGR